MGEQRPGGHVLDRHTLERGQFGPDLLDRVARDGVARVRGALPDALRHDLLAGAQTAPEQFLSLPRRTNRVVQGADQLTVRIGDPAHPCLNALAGSLSWALGGDDDPDMRRFSPTEGRYMRYVGPASGLGAHRDGKCYRLVVCVFSLAGRALFTVLGDAATRPCRLLVEPGDLVLLRAPGLRGTPDGRPRHAVGPARDGERVSLTVRMNGSGPVSR